MILLPKVCGGDIEVGNFVMGLDQPYGSGAYAAQALLREFDGVAARESSGGWLNGWGDRTRGYSRGSWPREGGSNPRYGWGGWGWDGYPGYGSHDPQDIGRKFLPSNGGCVYEDLSHLELCLPEVVSAWDWVACWFAMLRLTHDARAAANELQPAERPIQVLVNNSDGLGHSYGGHFDLLITREAWENLMHRRLHYLAYLVAFQVSSIILTGQGKVGSENGAPSAAFQLTQRGDFFETILGRQTTYRRPLVNTRDEPLCGVDGSEMEPPGGPLPVDGARLHVIFFDSTLCHVATLLRVGTMQIVLSMLEAGRLDATLALDDPLEALTRWGHDPTLSARAPLTSGMKLTAVELQLSFLEEARRFVEDGACDASVPRAREIISLWEETLGKLQDRDYPGLVGKLDWVTKQALIHQAMGGTPHLGWDSREVKYLDHFYSSLPDGLFFDLDRDGLIQHVVAEEEVQRFTHSPPEDTRAWGRSFLLRMEGAEDVCGVDWDWVRFRDPDRGWDRARQRRIEMANPLGWTREALEPVIAGSPGLENLLERFGQKESPRDSQDPLGTGDARGIKLLGGPRRDDGGGRG
jgi:proteasome accessory factor A